MATKKKRRTDEIKVKKKKKRMKKSFLFLIITTVVACLILFFVIIFEYVFPPTKDNVAKKEKQEVVLYFSDANERFLVPEKRYIPKEENDQARARELVKALLEGSKTKLVRTFPEGVALDNIRIDDKQTAYVSFDKNLIKQHPGGSTSEMATIYSLTNTLMRNINSIKRVKLLIDGKEVESIKGHVDTRQPFTMNKDMLAPGAKEG
ncbi:MAG: GerMN domain-containing protein [Syntrophales bacterium]|jgi:cell division protein YceG involved in septum cleavage